MTERKRKFTQLICAVLYNFHITGFAGGSIYKGRSKGICVPGLNCYSCPGAAFACPLGSLQGALASSVFRMPLYVIGTLLLFGILFGRMICGFLCPFGLLQELLALLPVKKIPKNRFTRTASGLKYVILFLFAAALPVLGHFPAFCKYICPAGTLEAGIPLVLFDGHLRKMVGGLFTWKVIVLVGCILLCVFFYRGFCRFLCPLGALYSIFNPTSFFGVRVDKKKCTGCNACIRFCKMDTSRVGDRECIHCGACRTVCPEDAICFKKVHK